jgi:hypothetical protein
MQITPGSSGQNPAGDQGGAAEWQRRLLERRKEKERERRKKRVREQSKKPDSEIE